MSYLLKSKPKKTVSLKVIFASLLFVFLFFLLFFFPNGSKSIVYTVAKPFWNIAEYSMKPFSILNNYIKTKNSIIEDNLSLNDEISRLRLKEIDYYILLKQTDDLKSQLGRINTTGKTVARILSKPPLSPYDTFVVDVGQDQEVKVESKVFVSDNIIIGMVRNVNSNTALVELFSSSGVEHEAVSERIGTTFKLTGLGGGNFKIEVPKDVDILWGDSFVYPNLTSAVLGNVYFIDSNAQSSFKTVYVRTPINVFSSKYVFIEKQ